MPEWLAGIPEWCIAVVLGLAGGVLRVVIGGVFVRPQRRTDSNNLRVYYLGSLRPIVAGGVAAWVAWVLTTDALYEDQGFGPKTIVATILAGVAGTEILLHYVGATQGVTINSQESGTTAESQANLLESVYKDLRKSQERERKLQDEKRALQDENRKFRKEAEP
jgi:hypothetical protein